MTADSLRALSHPELYGVADDLGYGFTAATIFGTVSCGLYVQPPDDAGAFHSGG